jgi:hypothetical protein
MSILIDRYTRVLIQGATGSQARFDIKYCLEYGTKIVAGVTPGRGGEHVEGVPIFNTVDAAVRATGANASAIYVPARAVGEAIDEALDSGIGMLLSLARRRSSCGLQHQRSNFTRPMQDGRHWGGPNRRNLRFWTNRRVFAIRGDVGRNQLHTEASRTGRFDRCLDGR